MPPYSSLNLMGDIYVDKGLIAMVWGRILDADGNIVQNCRFYPYTDSFSLAGSVNAELLFGLLEPGHYAYVVSAIAENNSYSSGEVILSIIPDLLIQQRRRACAAVFLLDIYPCGVYTLLR